MNPGPERGMQPSEPQSAKRQVVETSESPGAETASNPWNRGDWIVAAGILLVVLAIYLLSAPGRIDIIDGQYRYEVTRGLLDGVGVRIRDPALGQAIQGVDGFRYSFYGPGASILALPLVAVARALGGGINSEMFAFSLTSCFVVSFCVSVFYVFRRRLGSTARNALGWSFVLAFATPLWPLATTVFDQGQLAMLLFVGTFLAWEARQRKSLLFAVAAGVVAGGTVMFQESMCILLPFVGVATLDRLQWKRPLPWLRAIAREPLHASTLRYFVFGAATLVPFLAWMDFNYERFGNAFDSGKSHIAGHPPLFANVLVGLAGQLFSPGKSVLLFFPTVVLGIGAVVLLVRRRSLLGVSIASLCAVQLIFSSSLSFWASDWAWGPRYTMLLAPFLTLPVALRGNTGRSFRWLAPTLVTAGILVQLMGISVDHQRFFFERRLSAYFWNEHPEFYFANSQWFSRPKEVVSLYEGAAARDLIAFRPGPYAGSLPTYCIFGLEPATSDVWMRSYDVFYLPRPWPFWLPELPAELRPVEPGVARNACLAVGGLGGLLLLLGLVVLRRSSGGLARSTQTG